MKLTALSTALIAALGMTTGCSTQNTLSQASRPAVAADAPAQYALGRYYQGQQRYELAIESYRRALAANPAHVGAHNGLGASLLLAGRNAEAIEQFKAGLKHEPTSAPLWNNLGYAYALGGENGLAQMAYKQSLDLDPTDLKTNTNLAATQQTAPAPIAVAQAPAQAQPRTAFPSETRSVPLHAATASVLPTAKETSVDAATSAASPVLAKVDVVEVAKPGENHPVPVYSVPASTTPPASETPAVAAPSAGKPAEAKTIVAHTETTPAIAAPAIVAEPDPAEPAVKLRPAVELATAPVAASTVQVVEVAPRVYEMNLRNTNTIVSTAEQVKPAPVAGVTNISIPLHDAAIRMAAINPFDFVLEIRNGNGVRHMALRTSRYLADYGYSTRHLTNQRGFSVKVTRVFYLPGYVEEAERLLAHLPKDTVLTETSNMRRGTHVRVVLGKDMVQHQASLDAAKEKIQLAALQP